MKKNKLSCETARKIPVERALESLGHLPTRDSEREAWYLSPLRSETRASFKVSKKLNRWYDHGEGIGGNVIDLIAKMYNVSVMETLEARLKTVDHNLPEKRNIGLRESNIEIKRVKPIQHPALLEYLTERKINLIEAKRFCKQVHYTIGDKPYFSIGLQNNSGGWELRNRYCKISSSPKDLKWIENGSQKLIVLEGMFDLLSWIGLYPVEEQNVDFLVLNSVSLAKKALPIFEGFESIELYLDNDEAGRRTTGFFRDRSPKCSDRSDSYRGFKDLNELLLKNKRK